jgi:hypothetical protein
MRDTSAPLDARHSRGFCYCARPQATGCRARWVSCRRTSRWRGGGQCGRLRRVVTFPVAPRPVDRGSGLRRAMPVRGAGQRRRAGHRGSSCPRLADRLPGPDQGALQPGEGSRLGLGLAVDALGGVVELNEPVSLDGVSPATALATYSSIPRRVRRARVQPADGRALHRRNALRGRDKNLLSDRQPPAVARISYMWKSLPRRHPSGK